MPLRSSSRVKCGGWRAFTVLGSVSRHHWSSSASLLPGFSCKELSDRCQPTELSHHTPTDLCHCLGVLCQRGRPCIAPVLRPQRLAGIHFEMEDPKSWRQNSSSHGCAARSSRGRRQGLRQLLHSCNPSLPPCAREGGAATAAAAAETVSLTVVDVRRLASMSCSSTRSTCRLRATRCRGCAAHLLPLVGPRKQHLQHSV